MSRMIALSTGALALILLAAHPASAAGPIRASAVVPPGTTFDITNVCDFPVRVLFLKDKEYTKTFQPAADGTQRQLINGSLVLQFTNLVTNASLIRNVSGPGETIFYADGSNTLTARGVWAMFFPPGQLGAGTPGTFFINHGQIVLHTASGGFPQSILRQVGTQEDICAALE